MNLKYLQNILYWDQKIIYFKMLEDGRFFEMCL